MSKKALMEELEHLGKLHQAGVLSQAEFETEKAGILSQLRAFRENSCIWRTLVGHVMATMDREMAPLRRAWP